MSQTWYDSSSDSSGEEEYINGQNLNLSPSSQPLFKKTKKQTCLTCGSSSFSMDKMSGCFTCNDCMTQSQVDINDELDIEDVEKMGARDSRGLQFRRNPRVRSQKEQVFKTTLPTEKECLSSFGYVLKVSVSRLCGEIKLTKVDNEIMSDTPHNDNDETFQILDALVSRVWFTYLKVWKRGAKLQSQQHSDTHFSLRDVFLERLVQSMTGRNRSKKNAAAASAADTEAEATLKTIVENSSDSDSVPESDPELDTNNNQQNKKRKVGQKQQNTDDIDKFKAALLIVPKLKLLPSLLFYCLKILGTGVTEEEVLKLCKDNVITYFNAAHILPDELWIETLKVSERSERASLEEESSLILH